MRFTVLDPQPTCGAVLRLDNATESRILVCSLDLEHVEDHEDDEGNRWRITYEQIATGNPEGVAFRWGGVTRLPL